MLNFSKAVKIRLVNFLFVVCASHPSLAIKIEQPWLSQVRSSCIFSSWWGLVAIESYGLAVVTGQIFLEKLLWGFWSVVNTIIIMSSRMVYHPLIDSLPQFCTILIWNECVEIGWSCGAEKSGYLLVYTMTRDCFYTCLTC